MSTDLLSTKKEKTIFIETLRILACFLVIVNHTNSKIFLNNTPSALWFISLSYFFVSKIAVPLFIMIAGYNLLGKQDSYKKCLTRAARIGICLLLASGFYYWSFYHYGEIKQISIKDFAERIINKPITTAFWYLYLYLSILVMLPFLQKMTANMEKRDFHAFFLISGIFAGTWPIAEHYIPKLNYTNYFELPIFGSYICMLMLGAYVKKYCIPAKKWRGLCILGFLLMTACNVGLTYLEYNRKAGKSYLFFDNRGLLPIVIASFCIFYAISTLRFGDRASKWLPYVGSLTFGIYLFSDFFIKRLTFVYTDLLKLDVYPMFAMLVFEIIVFLTSAAATILLKEIPIIKKLL